MQQALHKFLCATCPTCHRKFIGFALFPRFHTEKYVFREIRHFVTVVVLNTCTSTIYRYYRFKFRHCFVTTPSLFGNPPAMPRRSVTEARSRFATAFRIFSHGQTGGAQYGQESCPDRARHISRSDTPCLHAKVYPGCRFACPGL